MNHPIVAALDIGSSKVCCIIAHINKDKKIKMAGYGYNASKGIKNGVITDINNATLSVCSAVEAAEQNAHERINGVILNVSGEKTCASIYDASIALKRSRPIGEADINKLMEKGLAKIDVGKNELIHCLLTNYKVDDGENIKDPRNIYGDKLAVNILLGMYPNILYKNLSSVVEEARLNIDSKVLSAYASGLACLIEDEREYGATIIDIGGGTTSIATFKDGFPVAFSTLPVGGIHITKDITYGLTTSFEHAEDLKVREGYAFGIGNDERTNISVFPLGEEDDNSARILPRSELINIIVPRVEEMFEMIKCKLDDHGLHNAPNHRVVLTGGCSQLRGIRDVAKMILDKQVRLGNPRNIADLPDKLNNPVFSTALGMLLFATNNIERKPKKIVSNPIGEGSKIAKIFNWIRQNS